ncbi:phage collar protein [Mycetohabitans sp. B46]|uniref:phage collar protein n=1 Tax=Mycetohabitans sp. B46 TaxID=2772536 RepID=UPI00307D8522
MPGSNLLSLALSVIGKQRVEYYRFLGRETNDVGIDVNRYAPPVPLYGSVQAVDRNLYQYLGLDFQKRYIRLYACAQLQDVARDRSSDQIEFASQRYQLLSDADWFNINGWDGALCVQI